MENFDSDIIVIGAGGCGLMAALVAAKKGARVLVLEKTDKPGGGTAFSSKGIRAAGSRRQRELKIADSPELYAQDILRRNNNESDAVLTQRLTETSGRDTIGFMLLTFSQKHGKCSQVAMHCACPLTTAHWLSKSTQKTHPSEITNSTLYGSE